MQPSKWTPILRWMGLGAVLLVLVIVFLAQRSSCPESSSSGVSGGGGPEFEARAKELHRAKEKVRGLLRDVAKLRATISAVKGEPGSDPALALAATSGRTSSRAAGSGRSLLQVVEYDEETTNNVATSPSPKRKGVLSGGKFARPPKPITLEEALRRVRQIPVCLEMVRSGWAQQGFTSQYAQDWFLFVNYFHHLETGFYLDIGANEPKSLSNTWFLHTGPPLLTKDGV